MKVLPIQLNAGLKMESLKLKGNEISIDIDIEKIKKVDSKR